MIYTAINNKPLKEAKHAKHAELIDAFVDVAFFKFMDSGRAGLAAAAVDFIDTSSKWIQLRVRADFVVNDCETSDRVRAILIDGFIKGGTSGLRDGLITAYITILNSNYKLERIRDKMSSCGSPPSSS